MMRRVISSFILLFALSGISIWFFQKTAGMLALFFIIAITIAIIYFATTFYTDRDFSANKQVEATRLKRSKFTAVIFLLILYIASIFVLRSYQLPSGSTPYFTNADAYGISNTGIAFKSELVLFNDQSNPQSGLWNSDTGKVSVLSTNGDLKIGIQHFYSPVFSIHPESSKSYLLNPQILPPFQKGFVLEDDDSNRLEVLDFSTSNGGIFSSAILYNLKIRFTTRDPAILQSQETTATDTISLESIQLRKGLELKDMVYRYQNPEHPQPFGNLVRWLALFDNISLVSSYSSTDNSRSVRFFASSNFYQKGHVYLDGKEQKPIVDYTAPLLVNQHFYIGYSKQKQSMEVRSTDNVKWLEGSEYKHILHFNQINYFALTDLQDTSDQPGRSEIRFLKNTTTGIEKSKLRDGLLFHENLRDNKLTRFDSYHIKYTADYPGNPLQMELWAPSGHSFVNNNKGIVSEFAFVPEDKSVAWMYSVRNFYDNPYSFLRLQLSLGLMILALIGLIVFAPSTSLLFVEIPTWIVFYSLMVFRLLLLWRLSTFPPINNISTHEFNTLLDFDMSLFGITLPLPFSVILFLFIILLIYLKRTGYLSKWLTWLPVIPTGGSAIKQHLIISFSGLVLFFVLRQDFLSRILGILLPLAVYLFFTYKAISDNSKFKYTHINKEKASLLTRFLLNWIETPLFYHSFITFIYLAVTDRGYAVIFLLFLVIRNILFNFSRTNAQGVRKKGVMQFLQPERFQIYGLLAFILFFIFITQKGFVRELLDNKQLFILFILFLLAFIIFQLLPFKQTLTKLLLVLTGLAILLMIFFPSFVNDRIDKQIRNVKYRASILVDPLNDILLDYKYQSGSERKIIETAQNQWYIHSYLNKAPFITSSINFQPHFNTGVDYSTQTRDVVLSRYILAEFGGLVMFLLLILLSIPLVLYFLSYRMTINGQLNADSVTGATAFILLFTTALIVWMSSTNRFVFFGQDFPFLSLTSRISVLIPLMLLFVALTRNPVLRKKSQYAVPLWIQLSRWALFFISVSILIAIGGKSRNLDVRNFKLDFAGVEKHFNEDINSFFTEVQTPADGRLVADILEKETKPYRLINEWFNRMEKDPGYQSLLEQLSLYERSVIESLKELPQRGFDLRSPVNFINKNNQYRLVYNKYYQFELPAYTNQDAWRGDVYEQSADQVVQPGESASVKIVQIPDTWRIPGEKPFAILDLKGSSAAYIIYNTSEKRVINYHNTNPVIRISTDNIVFIKGQNGNYVTWTIGDGRMKYFAYNMKINGRQRMIYPAGESMFWIKEWTEANKLRYEDKGTGNLQQSVRINMDYDLTKSVFGFLNTEFRADVRKVSDINVKKVVFSVIAADGDGRIRLMTDFSPGRKIINPNDETRIYEMQREEFFMRDNEMARLQWGNTNLLKMNIGPGSSIKPLVAASVMSMKKMNWDQLVLIDKRPDKIIRKYAGLELDTTRRGAWKEDVSDGIAFTDYLSLSKNTYHSFLVFLGSYKAGDITTDQLENYLKPIRPDQINLFFPVMKIGGAYYTLPVNTAEWPKIPGSGTQFTYFTQPNSMIANGMTNSLGLATVPNTMNGMPSGMQNISHHLPDSFAKRFVWSFPEESYFNQEERAGTDLKSNFSRGMRMPSLGGGIFALTPLKVAEMYGRLFNFDPDFTLYIDSSKKRSENASWNNIDPKWGTDFAPFLSRTVFTGMNKAAITGTARFLSSGFDGYDIYTKTGTIDDAGDDNSKRLAVIIVKKGSEQNIEMKKKYIVYFTVSKAYKDNSSDKAWINPVYKEILNRIINSSSFKEYMQ